MSFNNPRTEKKGDFTGVSIFAKIYPTDWEQWDCWRTWHIPEQFEPYVHLSSHWITFLFLTATAGCEMSGLNKPGYSSFRVVN